MGLCWNTELGDANFGKFASAESALAILSKGSLKWTRPGAFNDPFDSQAKLHAPLFDDALKTLLRDAFSDLVLLRSRVSAPNNPFARTMAGLADHVRTNRLDIEQVLDEIFVGAQESLTASGRIREQFFDEFVSGLQQSKILCLTRSFDNILMWSHYADSHKGVLIVFGANSPDSQFRLAAPVQYQTSIPSFLEPDEFSKMFTGQLDFSSDEMTSKIIDRVIMTKSLDWSYENEWRVVGGKGFSPDAPVEYNSFHVDDVRAVVFGARYDADVANSFRKAAAPLYPSSCWFRARLSNDRFAVDLERL